ncbi:type II secretion system protein GspG [Mitsuokella multacida]
MLQRIAWHRKGAVLQFDSVNYLLALIIFVSVGLYGFTDYVNSSKRNTAHADLVTISSAVSQYNYDLGVYPESLSELTSSKSVSGNTYGPWLVTLNKDPWGNDYQYSKAKNLFVVYSSVGKGVTVDANKPPEKKSDTDAVFVVSH